MKNLSFLNKGLYLVNCIVALFLVFSYTASYIHPGDLWPIAFFGLAYPFLLIINILFIIYWGIQFKKQIILSLVIVLAGWSYINRIVRFVDSETNSDDGKFKVMSYNVRLFDLYNWTKNKESRNKIFKLLEEESPDILCLQEFFHADRDIDFTTLDTMRTFLKAKNEHIVYTSTVRKTDHFGIATFSRFPIINRGQVEFEDVGNNVCIFSDIIKEKDTLRVYNCHLASIHFAKEDYRFIEEIEKTDSEKRIKGGKQIIRRLKTAFIKRAKQAEVIYSHMKESPYPVILCGDFNDSPLSYTYQTLKQDFSDAFNFGEKGLGFTYIGNFPSYRIDYLLFGYCFSASGFKTIKKDYSDHYPITCDFKMINGKGM